MALIPAAPFTMGATGGDSAPGATTISVNVSTFYMDVNLVSWSQWQSVYYWAKDHGYSDLAAGAGKGANHPVHTVDWYDSVKWCNARSEQAGKPAVYFTDAGLTAVYPTGEPNAVSANWSTKGYRLPTEAEWEKAARDGLGGQRFPWGNTISENQANYAPGPGQIWDLGGTQIYAIAPLPYTSPVGSFAPNGYGLYDMAGNVWEWCWDWYGSYGSAAQSAPRGPASGTARVKRGGSWDNNASSSLTALRNGGLPANWDYYPGFRSVLSPGQP